MNTVDFPSLSRTNLSKKDVPNTWFTPKKESASKVKTVWAEHKPTETKEAWMIICEEITSGKKAFDESYFWGFRAPILFDTYERSFKMANIRIKNVRDLKPFLETLRYETEEPMMMSESEDMDEDQEVVIHYKKVVETPQQRFLKLGVKSTHMEPLMNYISLV